MIISPGVRVCDGGKFYNLQYEKAIRSGKMIVALTCKENNKKVRSTIFIIVNKSATKEPIEIFN